MNDCYFFIFSSIQFFFLIKSVFFTPQGAFTQIKCSSPLFIGGVPEYDNTKRTAGVEKPFTGIIQKVLVNPLSFKDTQDAQMKWSQIFTSPPPSQPPPPFISPPQLILNDRTIPITVGSAGGINVANSVHPCVESPCANGGTCRPKWDVYECDCPLGYDGKHCQKGQL